MCLDAPSGHEGDVIVYWCHGTGGTQFWEYLDGLLKKDDFCLEYRPKLHKLVVANCKNEHRNENRVRKTINKFAQNQTFIIVTDLDVQERKQSVLSEIIR